MPARLLVRFLAILALIGSATAPASAQDAADLVVRLNRTEGQVRQLSGQIEQLQFENRQLKDQMRKFQEDVEFRFQEARGGARAAAPAAQNSGPSAGPTPPPPTRPSATGRRGDAFDPGAESSAPGAPRPLGTTPPSAPLSRPAITASTPSGGAATAQGRVAEDDETPSLGGGPLDIHQLGRLAEGGAAPKAAAPAPPRPAQSVAATATGDPRAEYDAAYAYLLQKQYEQAELGFRQFIQSHPREHLVADATFWLGETYLARSRHREAAEQFLKVSTDFSRSAKGPDAMLKLGVSLQALGARDQACATFAELERKYPQAGASVRHGVEREQKRARCAA